ncbi:hypothetical protein REPUB_Repub14bG0043400 [Reevesia pubescens]
MIIACQCNGGLPNSDHRIIPYQRLWLRVQLPELLVEYYDMKTLQKIGNLIGKPIKIDIHTGNVNRAQYARICVEIKVNQVLPQGVLLDGYWQQVSFEFKSLFAFIVD